jgi:hypothetical protein
MDAHGAMLWQAQVFRALRGEAVEGATSQPSPEQVMADVAARLGLDLTPGKPAKLEWPSLLGKAPKGPSRSMWRRRTIEGTHPAVTAKIARLVTAYVGGPGSVAVPVNLRQHLPGMRITSTADGMVNVDIGADEDWNDVYASLLTALDEHQYLAALGEHALLKLPLPLLRALRIVVYDGVRKKGLCDAVAIVSDLGTVDLADFRADGFEATAYYSLGSVEITPELNIVESQGRTEVTIAWRDGPGLAERAEALLDWIAGPRGERGDAA